MSEKPQMKPFAANQVAASLPARPSPTLVESLKDIAGDCQVDVLDGAVDAEELSATGFFEKVRHALSEDARAIDQLTEALENGEAVIVVGEITSDESASAVAEHLIENDAGWIFHFDDLSWTEMHSPAMRDNPAR